MASIWTNLSCFARKDVVFMATQPGRACAQSVGERKINEKSKGKSRRTGLLLRGWYFYFSAIIIQNCNGIIFLFFILPLYVVVLLGSRERKRKHMPADISGHNHNLQSLHLTSLRKERLKRNPAKSILSQSFSLHQQKHPPKKVFFLSQAHTSDFYA